MGMSFEVDSVGGNGRAGRKRVVAPRLEVRAVHFDGLAVGPKIGAARGNHLAVRGNKVAADGKMGGIDCTGLAAHRDLRPPRRGQILAR
jgi:hypothetical protein